MLILFILLFTSCRRIPVVAFWKSCVVSLFTSCRFTPKTTMRVCYNNHTAARLVTRLSQNHNGCHFAGNSSRWRVQIAACETRNQRNIRHSNPQTYFRLHLQRRLCQLLFGQVSRKNCLMTYMGCRSRSLKVHTGREWGGRWRLSFKWSVLRNGPMQFEHSGAGRYNRFCPRRTNQVADSR